MAWRVPVPAFAEISRCSFSRGSTRYGLPPPGKQFKGKRRRPCSFAAAESAAMKWEDVDEKLAKMVSMTNLDHASERRRVREAFKDVQLRIDHPLFRMQYAGVKTKESIEVNSRGFGIFSKSWLPRSSPVIALVCFCHGYGDTCTFFFEGIAKKLAASGYGVFALDYPGYGLSDGLHGYIQSFDSLVDDVVEHFSKIKENPEYQNLPSFLFGQSMGGAVALKVHFKQPHAWDGAVLLAPMCKMGEDVVPPWPLLQLLICTSKFFPKLKLVPPKDIAEMGFKEQRKREQASYNVIAYKDKPRLKTASELLKTTKEIGCQLEEQLFCRPLSTSEPAAIFPSPTLTPVVAVVALPAKFQGRCRWLQKWMCLSLTTRLLPSREAQFP